MQQAAGFRKWVIVWSLIASVPVVVAVASVLRIRVERKKAAANVEYAVSNLTPPVFVQAPSVEPVSTAEVVASLGPSNVPATSRVAVPNTDRRDFLDGRHTLRKSLEQRNFIWETAFRQMPPTNISPEIVARPTPRQVEQWKREHNLIRLAPYPYFNILSIPNDGCSQTPASPLFINQLLSRKYGLDFASSFQPFVNVISPNGTRVEHDGIAYPRLALFCGDSSEPKHFPFVIDNDKNDSLALLLTYFYRGWLDHIHDWSDGSGWYISQVVPHAFELSENKTIQHDFDMYDARQPTAHNADAVCAQVFVLELDVAGELGSFELTLRDKDGFPHFIVYKRPLGERPGWDISALDKSQLKQFFLKLADEKNVQRKYASNVGDGPLHGVRATFHGGQGKVTVQGVRTICLTREMVQAQMATMNKLNVLPFVSTWHGGVDNYWTCINCYEWSYDHAYPGSPETYHARMYAWGQVPRSPTYVADLYRQFGLLVHGQTSGQHYGTVATTMFPLWKGPDDHGPYYHFYRTMGDANDKDYPTWQETTADTLGETIPRILSRYKTYGQDDAIYTHYSYYSGNAFEGPPQMRFFENVRRFTPNAEAAFETLTNMKYNLDGQREFHQRMWCAPISTNARYSIALQHLPDHTTISGDNTIHITPWTDPASGKTSPHPEFVSQDLHGQTFYVADSKTARVFVAEREITSLKRNPADFTGRQSVTVVDTCTPTVAIDEVEPGSARNGHRLSINARYNFESSGAAVGQRCVKVQAVKAGDSVVTWMPSKLDSHETDYVRFFYRKSNPKSRIVLGWSQKASEPRDYVEPNSPSQPCPKLFRASDGDLQGHQGWTLPHFEDTDYHEVVLDYADMVHPNTPFKGIPRGDVISLAFGLMDAAAGDAVWFDCVEFLAARGVRPHAGQGLVIGGRLITHADDEKVVLHIEGQPDRTCTTEHGGWYMFTDVPAGAIVQMYCDPSDRENWTSTRFYPLQANQIQCKANSMEYWIHFYPATVGSRALELQQN